MKSTEVLINENNDQQERDEEISLKSYNEDSIEPMIKTIRKDNDLFITKICKKLIETIKNIDDDIPEQ